MAWDRFFGHDVYEVRAKTMKAVQRAYDTSQPTLLEIDTYRYRGHSVADANAEKYRSKEEIENYMKTKDPINLFQHQLISEGILTDEAAKEIDKAAQEEAKHSVQFAEESPFPEISSIKQDVYWEEDNPDHKISQGRIFFNDED
ncbi:MAG: thiamine pyrophosphate-dependent enzyme, partial [Verrucomicrobiota bacterium]